MASPFDNFKKTTFRHVRDIMGVAASWLPIGSIEGATPFLGKVLFSNPTETAQKYGAVYDAEAATMEYYKDTFPGLLEAVENRGITEIVIIDGVEHMVKRVIKKHDGDTYLASVQIYVEA